MRRKYSWHLLIVCSVAVMTFALAGEGRLWGQKVDLTGAAVAGTDSFVYLLEVQGQLLGEFSQCSGLGSSHGIEEQVVVMPPGIVVAQKTPGALEWHPIVLKCNGPAGEAVWQWRKTMESSGLVSSVREGQITMLTVGSSQPIAAWTFKKGWPARLVFNGTQQELVIVHEGLELGGSTGGATAPAGRTR
jgi:hypothetical protein